jgi:hypothetical protein
MRVWLIKRAVLLVASAGPVTVRVWTDVPDDDMGIRHTQTFASDTTAARDLDVRMPGTTRGRMVRFEVSSTGVVRIHAGWFEARPMDGGNWTKLAIAGLPGQLAGFADIALPIPPHPKQWADLPLPIAGAPKDWTEFPLPIPGQPKEFTAIALPIPGQPKDWTGLALPIPERPKDWRELNLPIRERPKGWREQPLPMQPTPEVGTWTELPVDA